MRTFFTFTALACTVLTGCPEPQEAKQVEEKKTVVPTATAPALTAMETIAKVRAEIEKNCGADLAEFNFENLQELELDPKDQEKADANLQMIGMMAQQCASYDPPDPKEVAEAGCSPDCHWCPIKWYWCIENAGACAGGDNKSCCKLGACGSKHHCEDVCKSSCGCDVPPLPADGGEGGEG